MKAIDRAVQRLRGTDHVIAASWLSAWKGCLSFLALVLVAFLFRHDEQSIVAIGKLSIALIGLASWFTDAYFIRLRWARELELDRRRTSPGTNPDASTN